MTYKDQLLLVVSLADLIASKRAAGRVGDLEDVRALDPRGYSSFTYGKGQIAIPKAVCYALNLCEGAKLMLEVRGRNIVLSQEPAWRKLQGAGAGRDMMKDIRHCQETGARA